MGDGVKYRPKSKWVEGCGLMVHHFFEKNWSPGFHRRGKPKGISQENLIPLPFPISLDRTRHSGWQIPWHTLHVQNSTYDG